MNIGANSAIIGFSLTGATIPTGAVNLVTIILGSAPVDNILCLSDPIISSPAAAQLPVSISCEGFVPTADVTYSLTSVDSDGLFVVSVVNKVPLSGFQLEVTNLDSDPVEVLGAVISSEGMYVAMVHHRIYFYKDDVYWTMLIYVV